MTKEIQRRLREEQHNPECWWYLSFARDREFAGGVIIKARGFYHAIINAGLRGQNPGGEIVGCPVPDENLPEEQYRNRLLSLAELHEFWSMETLKEKKDRAEN